MVGVKNEASRLDSIRSVPKHRSGEQVIPYFYWRYSSLRCLLMVGRHSHLCGSCGVKYHRMEARGSRLEATQHT